MTWTTYEDVQDRWLGEALGATQSQIETLIADAEDTILREFPDVQARIDDNSLPLIRVVKVTYNMIARVLRNPQGMRTTTKGSGPYQESNTFGGEEPGALYMTDADKRELQSESQGQEAFSINMTPLDYSPYYNGLEPGWEYL